MWKQRQEHALCSSLAVKQQKLFGVISSRKQDAAPLFSHRSISHFKIGKNNMLSYSERGLRAGQGRESDMQGRAGCAAVVAIVDMERRRMEDYFTEDTTSANLKWPLFSLLHSN